MSDSLPRTGRLAGIDYGTVRIGIAITDPAQSLASPLEILTRRDKLQDERYTTAHAEALLQDAGLTSKRRKERRDMLAAQILLAAYLESGRNTQPPGALEDRK